MNQERTTADRAALAGHPGLVGAQAALAMSGFFGIGGGLLCGGLLVSMSWPHQGADDQMFASLILVILAVGFVVGLGVGLPAALAAWELRRFRPWGRRVGLVTGAMLLLVAPPLGIVVLVGLMNRDVRRAFEG